MKKIFTIALMLIYLTFSSGVVIGNHFCGGRLDEIAFFKQPKDCCPDANSEKSCCKNTTLILMVKDNYDSNLSQAGSFKSHFIRVILENFPIRIYLKSLQCKSDFTVAGYSDHQLHYKSKFPIYLINRVFII